MASKLNKRNRLIGLALGLLETIAAAWIGETITRQMTFSRINERKAYWEAAIDSEIPTGTTKESIETWATSRHLKDRLVWEPDKSLLEVNVERVPNAGILFPCSDWNLIFNLYLGETGTLIRREVHVIGSCV